MTLEDLEAVASPEMIARGRSYWAEGYVNYMQVDADHRLKGTVTGSLGDYHVMVESHKKGLRCQCDCPYRRGFCKHAVALTWGWLNNPECFLQYERLQAAIDGLTLQQSRDIISKIATDSPGLLASVLGMGGRVPKTSIARQLAENLEKGDPAEMDWLKAWRRVLKMLGDQEPSLDIIDRLIGLGFVYLKDSPVINPDFVELFEGTMRVWSKTSSREECPPWWDKGWDVFVSLKGSLRRRMRNLILETMGEWRGAILTTLGYPCEMDEESFGSRLDYILDVLLLTGADLEPIKEWAMNQLDRILRLMDLLAEEGAWNLLKELARMGSRRYEPKDRFIFRARIAQAHRELNEPRQAFALLKTNFKERPGWGEYLELSATAKEAGEPMRALQVAKEILGDARVELLAKILMLEESWAELNRVALRVPASVTVAPEIAYALRGIFPETSLMLWEKCIGELLRDGTRRGVKEAIPYLIETKRLCRENNWYEAWDSIREKTLNQILDPVALEMTAALLEPLSVATPIQAGIKE